MAIEAQIPVTPVLCSPLGPLLSSRKGDRKLLSGTVRFRILPPVPTTGLTANDVAALRDRVRDQMARSLETLETTVGRG